MAMLHAFDTKRLFILLSKEGFIIDEDPIREPGRYTHEKPKVEPAKLAEES